MREKKKLSHNHFKNSFFVQLDSKTSNFYFFKKRFQQQNGFHNSEKRISISRIYLNCGNMRIFFIELKEFSIEWKMILHQQVKEKRNYLVLTFDTNSNCVAVSEEG